MSDGSQDVIATAEFLAHSCGFRPGHLDRVIGSLVTIPGGDRYCIVSYDKDNDLYLLRPEAPVNTGWVVN